MYISRSNDSITLIWVSLERTFPTACRTWVKVMQFWSEVLTLETSLAHALLVSMFSKASVFVVSSAIIRQGSVFQCLYSGQHGECGPWAKQILYVFESSRIGTALLMDYTLSYHGCILTFQRSSVLTQTIHPPCSSSKSLATPTQAFLV